MWMNCNQVDCGKFIEKIGMVPDSAAKRRNNFSPGRQPGVFVSERCKRRRRDTGIVPPLRGSDFVLTNPRAYARG